MIDLLVSRIAVRPTLRSFPGWILGCNQQGGDWLSKFRRWAWGHAKRPFTIPWLEGTRLLVSTPDQTLQSVFLTGFFEPNEFFFFDRVLRLGMTFVDVGANIGLYTLFAAAKVGNSGVVVSLEPSSREFRKLRANVELNHFCQVRSLRTAASDHAGGAELLVADEERAGHNTLGAFSYDTRLALKETVPMERIDELVRLENLQSVDVLKMDVEGAELFALKGAVRTLETFRPLLLIEMSDRSSIPQGSSSLDVWNFLEGLGYRFCSFAEATGLPVPAIRKAVYDGENLIAVHTENPMPYFSMRG